MLHHIVYFESKYNIYHKADLNTKQVSILPDDEDYDHAVSDSESVPSMTDPMILQEYNASETHSHHEGGC